MNSSLLADVFGLIIHDMRRRIPPAIAALLCVWSFAPPATASARGLSFEERVRAEAAIQRVYYSHQIGSRLPFEEVFPPSRLEDRVRNQMREAAALESFWGTRVTDEMLRAELSRMQRGSRMPERLREIFAALDDDPTRLLQCLAAPALVDRLARNFFAFDRRVHAGSRQEADTLRQQLLDGLIDPHADRAGREMVELSSADGDFAARLTRMGLRDRAIGPVIEQRDRFIVYAALDPRPRGLRAAAYSVVKQTWDSWWAEAGQFSSNQAAEGLREDSKAGSFPSPTILTDPLSPASDCPGDTWNNGSLDDLPDAREEHSSVWTGSVMIVWGGQNTTQYATGGRYDPATDTWSSIATTGAPAARAGHSAFWTGKVMLVWGGAGVTGGRYEPATDTWSSTSVIGAPSGSTFTSRALVWSGHVMVVWGCCVTPGITGGGRYDPDSDTWSPVSTGGPPVSWTDYSAVATGASVLFWGGDDCSGPCTPTNQGVAYDPVGDTWSPLPTQNAPAGRFGHSAVWTGREMIVWGGQPGTFVGMNTGGRYDPLTGLWTQMSVVNAPDPRFGHTALWTGSSMIVWGADTTVNTGGRYDPQTDTWSATTTTNAPTARRHHTAVWTGLQMIIWGGRNDFGAFSSGARYDPVVDAWTPTSQGGGPTGRQTHTAVWTGTQMIVWGGRNADSPSLDTGGRYDPAIDNWTPTSITASPSARFGHTSVWTGQEMVVWGGRDSVGATATGGRYDPVLDSWGPMSTGTAPTARSSHAAVWTGSTMIVWGGSTGSASLNSGGQYDPSTDTWSPTSLAGAPSARAGFSTAWAGNRLVIWGGQVGNALKNDGARYDPATDAWASTSSSGAPTPRKGHSAVSTGPTMIIWGGLTSASCIPSCVGTDSGAIYDPSADSWTTMSSTGAASARSGHTAVWTGDIMIIWGGVPPAAGPQAIATGARYHPPSNSWAPVSGVNAPGPRSSHSAVWTGDVMMIWGGSNLGNGGRYCPGTVPIYYRDSDGDGHGDPGSPLATYSPPIGFVVNNDDCTDIDSTWWSMPSEVRNLLVTDPVTLRWSSPANPGGVIVRYDALRSTNAADFGQSASCLATNITTLTCTDAQDPGPGQIFFYLIRAENGCPHGQGPLGYDSGGVPRSGRTCP